MNKTYIFAVLAFVFIAITAVADTTYVCEDVGDWDIWNVPYAKQQEMVQEGFVMEVTYYDLSNQSSIIVYYVNNPNNPLNICKPQNQCNEVCEPADYSIPKGCPCWTCSTHQDGTSAMVNDIVDLVLNQ